MHPPRQRDHRHDDQCHHGRAHAFECGVHDGVVADVGKQERDREDDDERRQNAAQQRRHGTFQPPHLVAYEHRGVDGDGARDGLCEGQQVEELLVLDPAALGDQLLLDERQHGVSPAEGEKPDLEEGGENGTKSLHVFRVLYLIRRVRRPCRRDGVPGAAMLPPGRFIVRRWPPTP